VIEGIVPSLLKMKREGCRFAPRVPWIKESSHENHPKYHEAEAGHFVLCSCYKDFRMKQEKEDK